jgi:hypothetical protein
VQSPEFKPQQCKKKKKEKKPQNGSCKTVKRKIAENHENVGHGKEFLGVGCNSVVASTKH